MPAVTLKKGEDLSKKTVALFEKYHQYTAGGFLPPTGFIVSGKGSTLTDVDGRDLIDFSVSMGAVNLGHCHPKITEAVVGSLKSTFPTNITVIDDKGPVVAEALCTTFGYDKVTAMVTGAEAADAAVKIARKWGSKKKGINPEDVLVIGTSGNYHGLSSGIWPMMTPGSGQEEYGISSSNLVSRHPETGELLRYGHVEDYESLFETHHSRIAAVIMEVLHGALPTFQEEVDFGVGVRKLCKKYNILFIADEVRMGCGKTGKFLCSDWLGPENKPDMIVLGKSITGGAFPASYVLGYNDTMSMLLPVQSASTFAMSPAGNAATLAALSVYAEPGVIERATVIQEKWMAMASKWKHPFISYCTARGADLVIVMKKGDHGVTASRISRLAYQRGLLTCPNDWRIRCSAALTITDAELEKALSVFQSVMDDVALYGDMPGADSA